MGITNLLDKITWWRDLPYPVKGALLRAIKAGLAVTVGILLAAALQGILFPAGTGAFVILIVTSILQALDKYLRENAIDKANSSEVLTDSPDGE